MYTPGPWYVLQWTGDEWPENRISVGPVDRYASTAVLISPRYPTKHVWYDAKLAAAAPDLLEALESAVKWDGQDDQGEDSVWLDHALSALAKARGENGV